MFNIILLLIPLIGILMIFTYSFSTFRNKDYIRLRLLVILSISLLIIPIKVILNITGILGMYTYILIATILLGQFFTCVYTSKSFPSLYNVLFTVILSITFATFVYPLLYYLLYIIFELQFFDYYTYLVSIIFHSVSDPYIIGYAYMIKGTPEHDQELMKQRAASLSLDYRCKQAYIKFLAESNSSEKRNKFRELMRLVGKRRDVCKRLDELLDHKSASNAFKNKGYSLYAANFIKSFNKK